MARDGAGRAQVADPLVAADIATKGYVDSAAGGDATSAPTPSTVMARDAAGRAQVTDPAVAADIATKGYVDGATAGAGPGTAKAWVLFNGTGTVAILDSHNVTSITDNGVGDYTVNIASGALPNADYCAVANVFGFTNLFTFMLRQSSHTRTATAYRMMVLNEYSAPSDAEEVNIAFFGD